EDPVGILPERVPGLLAIDHVEVSATLRTCLERSQIRARARFGIPLTPPVLAGDHARQEVFLLLAGTELHDDRCDHPHPEGEDRRRSRGAALLVEDMLLDRRPAGATE